MGCQANRQVSSQVHVSNKKTHFKADISCISLANNKLMDVTQLALTWVGWPNGEKVALTSSKFDLSQSEPKSSQVKARPGQTESQVDPGSQLAATCDSVWPGLNNKRNALVLLLFLGLISALRGEVGAASRDNAIFSGHRNFWAKVTSSALERSGLEVNFQPKISHLPD